MKALFFTFFSSILYLLVQIFGVNTACLWGLHQPRVPKLK